MTDQVQENQVEDTKADEKAKNKAEREAAKAKRDAEKAAKQAERDAKKAEREAKKAEKEASKGQPRGQLAGAWVKVLVDANHSGTRAGSGRFCLLAALGEVGTAWDTKDILNMEIPYGLEEEGKTMKLASNKIIGMYKRGHVALSYDQGKTWKQVQEVSTAEE